MAERKSREAIIASLLADGIMTEDASAALAAQAAADAVRRLVRAQQRPPRTKRPRATVTPSAPAPPPAAPPEAPAAVPSPPIAQPAKAR